MKDEIQRQPPSSRSRGTTASQGGRGTAVRLGNGNIFDIRVSSADKIDPMFATKGYATYAADEPLKPFSFERRDPTPRDVQIEILFCGICHSDLHIARNEWGGTIYPCVPGHEIVGRVVKVGREVKKFKEGDLAAVGCMVDSCQTCPTCQEGLEQYCDGIILTYNSKDRHTGGVTYGGYSASIVVDQDFVLRISDKVSAGSDTWRLN